MFDLEYLESIVSNGHIDDAKAYINEYFVHVMHHGIFFRDMEINKWRSIKRESVCEYLPGALEYKKYFKASRYLLDEVMVRYKMIVSPSSPMLDEKKKTINMMASPPHDIISWDGKVTNGVQAWLDHIFIVWASRDRDTYEYLLNWLSCTIAGKKVKTLLYLQSGEQTGKTVVIDFIRENVLGEDLTLMTDNVEILEKYTKPMEGKMLVNFNEMPCGSTGVWRKIMDRIKMLTTDPVFSCRDMYKASYDQKNTFNIIITTNNDAIYMTDTNEARYVCLDINEEMKGNYKYFKRLTSHSNWKVGKEFYNYMMHHFETKGKYFHSQIRPTTKMRSDKIAESIALPLKYIKEHYLSEGKDIKTTFEKLHQAVVEFQPSGVKPITKQKLSSMLKKLQCFETVSSGNFPRVEKEGKKKTVLRASFPDLYRAFDERNYISEIDDIEKPATTVKDIAKKDESESESDDEQASPLPAPPKLDAKAMSSVISAVSSDGIVEFESGSESEDDSPAPPKPSGVNTVTF